MLYAILKNCSLLDNVSRTKTISTNSCRFKYLDAAMLANSSQGRIQDLKLRVLSKKIHRYFYRPFLIHYTGSPPLKWFFETLTNPCKHKTVLFAERFSSRNECVLRALLWPYCAQLLLYPQSNTSCQFVISHVLFRYIHINFKSQ